MHGARGNCDYMDNKLSSKNTPLVPYIELDGGYAKCSNCNEEVFPSDKICPYCKQLQDWSWLEQDK